MPTVPAPTPGTGDSPATPGVSGRRVALLGNPNTGKTTLFNRLCGLRHKTSNFPGTTLEARVGRVRVGRLSEPTDDIAESRLGEPAYTELIDLPGVYSLELDQIEAEICRAVLAGRTAPRGERVAEPDAVCVVADATNLPRNLMFAGEALRRRLPTVVAVNMIDLSRTRGLHIEAATLAEDLGCAVVCVSARSGEGLDDLARALAAARIPTHTPPGGVGDERALKEWADAIYERCASGEPRGSGSMRATIADHADRAFTHPILGLFIFAAVMAGLFWTLFTLAAYPMDGIDALFGGFGDAPKWLPSVLHTAWEGGLTGLVRTTLPDGLVQDFVANGVVGGIGATVVFLPQICLLFFVIALLEDTGYLARAAFVVDRALRPFGLPGHAFVPLLSSHACALPGIMATRAIPDRRERLAAILVAPFMSCSARLPVYALLTGILFPTSPALAALAFVGCYALGIAAGVLSSLIARRTILRGESRPMVMELPSYKRPSLRTALLTTWDRGMVFVKNAGTNILCICIVLWWLSSYPKVDPPYAAVELRSTAASLEPVDKGLGSEAAGPAYLGEEAARAAAEYRAEADAVWRGPDPDPALIAKLHRLAELNEARSMPPAERAARLEQWRRDADRLEASHAAAHSFAGRIGRFIQPVFDPLGYDWKLSVGVITSFAAREVFASTMAVVVTGEENAEGEGVLDRIAAGTRDDGTPIFTAAVAWSLLVYYVLAMQCLPTLAVTARESGSWKWAALQQVWMSGLAYLAALLVFQVLR
ncbi:MAG: ferrous iron transporter B [Phycisphaerales bacterium]